jgi:BirA family biotin operon repressor/biotin-[acetyl-CoA-carboxylase] ligase
LNPASQPLHPLFWPAEAIWEAVVPLIPDFSVEILPSIDSTNTELMRRARAGRMEPVLLLAEQQTAGRGRLGRNWQSAGAGQTGGSLTFSLGLPLAPRDWSGLSLVVGTVVAEQLHPELRLKWPNDVWLRDRKLAGILIETASVGDSRYAVLGVGINVQPPPGTEGLSVPPACVQELRPELDAPQVLGLLVPRLVHAVKTFEREGFRPFQARFNAVDALAGRPVELSEATVGVARGVDETGALLVHTAAGVKKITSSEVSVRPVLPQRDADALD